MATQKNDVGLTPKEEKFVALYIELDSLKEAVIQAGFNTTNPTKFGRQLLTKKEIQDAVRYELEMFKNEHIASAEEIMAFYTDVMRGKEKDQFGLDTPIAERLKAANELAKRRVDLENVASGNTSNELKITLDWDKPSEKSSN